MSFAKTDCFGSPPLLLVLLMFAIVAAGLAVRLWRQGFILHAAFVFAISPEYADAVFLEMVVTGMFQLVCLSVAYTMIELTPIRHVRLRAVTAPGRELRYSAAPAPSA